MKNFTESTKGTIYAICAFTFWGLVPIYFKAVSHVGSFEILAHRIVWSVLFLAILILFTKHKKSLIEILKNKNKLKILFISAILVSTNWLVFIWAISSNMITEASLGYYINPLVNVLLGMLFFSEKPNKLQILSIFIAFTAIVYQLVALKDIPFVSLALAFSFGFYTLFRKKVNVPSATGLLIETILISPIALGYMTYLFYTKQSHFDFDFTYTSTLLVLAGLITIVPLLWFNGAATRISMVKLGFLQYIGPSIAFLLAIFVYDEPFSQEKLYTFILIWVALIIFTLSDIKKLNFIKSKR